MTPKTSNLSACEKIIRGNVERIIKIERETADATIYDRVEIGLYLLKARRELGSSTVCSAANGQKRAKTGEWADMGLMAWVKETLGELGISQRSLYDYMAAAEALGLTASMDRRDIETLRSEQALHGKSIRGLLAKAPGKQFIPGEDANGQLLMGAILSLTDSTKQIREFYRSHLMPPAQYEVTVRELQETLEEITGCEWGMSDGAGSHIGSQHGEVITR